MSKAKKENSKERCVKHQVRDSITSNSVSLFKVALVTLIVGVMIGFILGSRALQATTSSHEHVQTTGHIVQNTQEYSDCGKSNDWMIYDNDMSMNDDGSNNDYAFIHYQKVVSYDGKFLFQRRVIILTSLCKSINKSDSNPNLDTKKV